jgi:DNA polymerase-3 subunit alpha
VLLCIGTGKTFNDPKRLRYEAKQFFLKTAEQMSETFRDYPDAVANTVRIAERCNVQLSSGINHLPTFAVPPGFTTDTYFEHVVREGFKGRLPRLRQLAATGRLKHTIEEYERRLDYELDVIRKTGFQGYLLIVWDFIRYAREQGIPVGPGRGSAAASVAAWCMRIADVDPMDFDLLFERFLNPERISMPDIDVDFCERRRGEVIEYVTRKYGRENVAQIITFGTMKAKAVIKDVGRALEWTFADVDRVAKQIPPALDMTLDKALEENATLREMEQNDPRVKELFSVARRLEGMTRHASVHAAGVVIAPKAITEYAPLYKGARDEIVTQWTMKDIERMGLLKMDFLGLSTLTLIDDALNEIRRTENVELDIHHLPLDDAETFKVFADAATNGIFQFESSGMRRMLKVARPNRFEDLIALNAMFRPGPMENIPSYCRRKHGQEAVTYPHPLLEAVLGETYGVMVYQEQVMQAGQILGGYSLGGADLLRKAMGKKKPEEMARHRAIFRKGAAEKGITAAIADEVFDLMEKFAGYGFNKAHATAYALLAYRTAYLKAHYPWHFAASLLTIESQNTEKLAIYLAECRERGIPVLPPGVNESELRFTVEPGKGVRFGLTAIKNVGEGAIESLLAVRRTQQRITSLHALCEELDLRLANKRVFESLTKAGAFDSLAKNDPALGALASRALRPRILAAIDAACEHGARVQEDRERGQGALFGPSDEELAAASAGASFRLPVATAWTEQEQLAFEKETLGLYWSGHPTDRYASELTELGARTTAELMELEARPAASEWGPSGRKPLEADVAVGGIIAAVRQLKTKKGERMAVFTLEDSHGSLEVLCFPDTFQKCGSIVEIGAMVIVRGKLERDEESARVLSTEVAPIETVREAVAREVAIRVTGAPDRQMFEALGEIFSRHRGDRRVSFDIELLSTPTRLRIRADVSSQIRVRPSSSLIAEIEQVVGQGSVSLR